MLTLFLKNLGVGPDNPFVRKTTTIGDGMDSLNPLLSPGARAQVNGTNAKKNTLSTFFGRKSTSTLTGDLQGVAGGNVEDEFMVNGISGGQESEAVGTVHVLSDSTLNYVPIHYSFKWRDASHEEYCGVVISLPTGVVQNRSLEGCVRCTVKEDCTSLCFLRSCLA